MKSVVITQAVELAGKHYYAGAAVVSDAEATALAAASALTGGATTYVPPTTLTPYPELDTLLAAIPAAVVADIVPGNHTVVPGSFADLAAVRTYLATLVSELETHRDAIDAAHNTVLARLRTTTIIAT